MPATTRCEEPADALLNVLDFAKGRAAGGGCAVVWPGHGGPYIGERRSKAQRPPRSSRLRRQSRGVGTRARGQLRQRGCFCGGCDQRGGVDIAFLSICFSAPSTNQARIFLFARGRGERRQFVSMPTERVAGWRGRPRPAAKRSRFCPRDVEPASKDVPRALGRPGLLSAVYCDASVGKANEVASCPEDQRGISGADG